jgi:peptidoglycan/xylan/chitin deacetylase (PgdA/CDA1 family)
MLGPISHVATEERVAALTFDDGPHPEYTPRLLDVLDKHGVRATFFMVGKSASRHPQIVRRIAAAGHAIGNHTWDHPSLPLLSGRERRAQIRACWMALAPYGQLLFRPPYGHLNMASRLDTFWLGHEVIGWSVTGEDWLDRDADWMAQRLIDLVRPGSIIVLHDALYHALEERYTDRTSMIDAVDAVLRQLSGSFRFISIPELLRKGRPQRRRSFVNIDVRFLNSLDPSVGEPRQYRQESR